jgi:hypothetical protein
MSAAKLLPAIRDLYSRHPEYLQLEPWELIGLLWSLGYTDDLADEGEVSSAVEVARTDWTGWAA